MVSAQLIITVLQTLITPTGNAIQSNPALTVRFGAQQSSNAYAQRTHSGTVIFACNAVAVRSIKRTMDVCVLVALSLKEIGAPQFQSISAHRFSAQFGTGIHVFAVQDTLLLECNALVKDWLLILLSVIDASQNLTQYSVMVSADAMLDSFK